MKVLNKRVKKRTYEIENENLTNFFTTYSKMLQKKQASSNNCLKLWFLFVKN